MAPERPGPDETLDPLSRRLRLLQRRRGHRATSDDVLLAGLALAAAPEARRILDLGTGKGTVGLLLADRLPAATVVGVEAVPQSLALARRNARLNGLEDRYRPRGGDLRDPAALEGEAPFDLICGAPPFMPLGTGVLPADAQRAAGRFELRGGIEDYARCAAVRRAPGGTVVLLLDGRSRARLVQAFADAGLALGAIVDVPPRPGRPPTFVVGVSGPARLPPTLPMRGATGAEWSAPYARLRASLDLP